MDAKYVSKSKKLKTTNFIFYYVRVFNSLEWFPSALFGDLVEVVLQESGPQIGALAVLGGDDQDVVHVVAGRAQESGCTRSTRVVHVAAVVCKMSKKIVGRSVKMTRKLD